MTNVLIGRCRLPGLALAIVIAGCSEAPPPAAVVADDPWLNPLPAQPAEPEPVPAGAYHLVTAERIGEAEAFLASEGISQISPGEVNYFAGRDITLPDVSRPWLIRGAYRSDPTFTVSIAGNALWVASGDDPGDASPVRHQPLVLIMDEVPETVYVTTGIRPWLPAHRR